MYCFNNDTEFGRMIGVSLLLHDKKHWGNMSKVKSADLALVKGQHMSAVHIV